VGGGAPVRHTIPLGIIIFLVVFVSLFLSVYCYISVLRTNKYIHIDLNKLKGGLVESTSMHAVVLYFQANFVKYSFQARGLNASHHIKHPSQDV